jgi:hypothetical protein
MVRSGPVQRGHAKPFRYENMWHRHHRYEETLVDAWRGGCESLGDVQTTLSRWYEEEFGSVKGEL